MRIGDLSVNESANSAVPWYRKIVDTLTQAGQAYITTRQQSELNKINLQRANQGLGPIDSTQYQTGVQVGVSSSTQNTALIIAGGVGVALILSSLLRGRRR